VKAVIRENQKTMDWKRTDGLLASVDGKTE